MEKYENEKGEVAVLVSSGFGAGWSSWNSNKEFLAMNKTVVEMHLKGVGCDEVEEYIKRQTGADYIYTGGWSDCEIEWISKGTSFAIEAYDGSESIRTYSDLRMTA